MLSWRHQTATTERLGTDRAHNGHGSRRRPATSPTVGAAPDRASRGHRAARRSGTPCSRPPPSGPRSTNAPRRCSPACSAPANHSSMTVSLRSTGRRPVSLGREWIIASFRHDTDPSSPGSAHPAGISHPHESVMNRCRRDQQRSLLALLYLIGPGSLLALTCYVIALRPLHSEALGDRPVCGSLRQCPVSCSSDQGPRSLLSPRAWRAARCLPSLGLLGQFADEGCGWPGRGRNGCHPVLPSALVISSRRSSPCRRRRPWWRSARAAGRCGGHSGASPEPDCRTLGHSIQLG